MTTLLNETHDPARKSWVDSANVADCDFPIQNLPFGVFARQGSDRRRIGVAIGDQILDLRRGYELGLFGDEPKPVTEACRGKSLKGLMALEAPRRSALRRRISTLLTAGALDGDVALVSDALVPLADATMQLPTKIGDYTDFYCSLHHATNVGSMFRPDNPLMPNYKHLPVGYHGRSSSIVTSGTPIRRPSGQTKADGAEAPSFGASRLLDYELEVGFFVGPGNELGSSIPIDQAEDHLFGFCLVNDWSARDIQKWEYQPLGPFLGKSFATSISPWIVTTEALAPFRTPAAERAEDDPRPLPHLDSPVNRTRGGIDLTVEVWLTTEAMREAGAEAVRLSRGNFRHLYWTAGQMVAHHASNGCNLRPGDLLASGTVSGAEKEARGCLLELTWRGSEPITLPSGETRAFLADGDEVSLRGYCDNENAVRIGFGHCDGKVLAAAAV